jgi:hypothetical protein
MESKNETDPTVQAYLTPLSETTPVVNASGTAMTLGAMVGFEFMCPHFGTKTGAERVAHLSAAIMRAETGTSS